MVVVEYTHDSNTDMFQVIKPLYFPRPHLYTQLVYFQLYMLRSLVISSPDLRRVAPFFFLLLYVRYCKKKKSHVGSSTTRSFAFTQLYQHSQLLLHHLCLMEALKCLNSFLAMYIKMK